MSATWLSSATPPGIFYSHLLVNTTLMHANVHCQECMCHWQGFLWRFPPVIWWETSLPNMRVGGMGSLSHMHCCSYIRATNRVEREKKELRRVRLRATWGSITLWERPLSRGGRRRGGKKWYRGKKAMTTSPTVSIDMGGYFVDVGLDVEEPTADVPPFIKKKKIGPEKRMVYKYLEARNFLQTSRWHIPWRVYELLMWNSLT